jgi:hypothetical protein
MDALEEGDDSCSVGTDSATHWLPWSGCKLWPAFSTTSARVGKADDLSTINDILRALILACGRNERNNYESIEI